MPMTLDEFRARVQVPRKVGGVGAALAGILILLLVRNLFAAWRSMDMNPGASFWDLFWTTTGTSGDTEGTLVVLVWGPVVLLPVIAVLTIIDVAIHGARVGKIYDRYLREGWVAPQVPTGIDVTLGKNTVPLVVLAGPGLPAEQLAAACQMTAARFAQTPAKEQKALRARLSKNVLNGYRAHGVLPELPPQAWLTSMRTACPEVAVIAAPDAAKATILPMKPSAVPAPV